MLGVVLALVLLLAFVLFRYREKIKSTSGAGSTLKILLAFSQIVWSMQEVFDLKFPPAFKWFVRYVMSWFSLQFLNALVGLECVLHNTYYDNLLLKTTVPILCTFMLVLVVAKSWASMASGYKTQERHNKTKDICLTMFLWMTFLILSSISSDLFLLFSCERFDDGSIQLKRLVLIFKPCLRRCWALLTATVPLCRQLIRHLLPRFKLPAILCIRRIHDPLVSGKSVVLPA